MAIDDNTLYGLTGAQIKELPGKIEAVKGKAKVLTAADYNYPASNPNGVALWAIPSGSYTHDSSVKVYLSTQQPVSGVYGYCVVNAPSAPSLSGVASILYWNTGGEFKYGQTTGGVQALYNVITSSDVIDNLTSTSAFRPLSANQGRVLKDMIDNLPTGGVTELTTADYNYDEGSTGTNNCIALWLLDEGNYRISDSTVKLKKRASDAAVVFAQNLLPAGILVWGDENERKSYIITHTSGAVKGAVAADGSNWTTETSIMPPTVVQEPGTNTNRVMSQNAVTRMVYADPSTKYKVQIGNGAISTGDYCITIGQNAEAKLDTGISVGYTASSGGIGAIAIGRQSTTANGNRGSIALGSYSNATQVGEMNIGSSQTSHGYNNSNYRLISGVYDGQSAHDAATYGQLSAAIINGGTTAPTNATVGAVGTLYSYVDTTGATPTPHLMVCTAVDATADPTTYTWVEMVGGSMADVETQLHEINTGSDNTEQQLDNINNGGE